MNKDRKTQTYMSITSNTLFIFLFVTVRAGGKGSMHRCHFFLDFMEFVFSEYFHHLIQLTCDYLVTEFEDLLPGIINQLGIFTTNLTSAFGCEMFLW
ncbi:hypothetical protein BHM03_00031705 [Ensete ventricosum]|nr:hypothetical protein BHM03_00031705 [Ensete ventricosum]